MYYSDYYSDHFIVGTVTSTEESSSGVKRRFREKSYAVHHSPGKVARADVDLQQEMTKNIYMILYLVFSVVIINKRQLTETSWNTFYFPI